MATGLCAGLHITAGGTATGDGQSSSEDRLQARQACVRGAGDCFRNMISIGKSKDAEIHNHLTESSSEEEIREYKRKRRELEDRNAQLERENVRTTEVMYIAKRFMTSSYLAIR